MNKSILIAALLSMPFGIYAMHNENEVFPSATSNKKIAEKVPNVLPCNKVIPNDGVRYKDVITVTAIAGMLVHIVANKGALKLSKSNNGALKLSKL